MSFSLLALFEYPYKQKIPQRHIYLIAEGHHK